MATELQSLVTQSSGMSASSPRPIRRESTRLTVSTRFFVMTTLSCGTARTVPVGTGLATLLRAVDA